MKKLLPLVMVLLIACTSQRQILDSWNGRHKKELILAWGPPSRTTSDGNGGEVLIYSNQSAYNGQVFWKHTMMYANSAGKIYFWRTQTNAVPPTQIVIQ